MMRIFLFLCLLVSTPLFAQNHWPNIIESKTTFDLNRKAGLNIFYHIFGIDGKPKYLLSCHDHYYEKDTAYVYSGDFECKLVSLYSKDRYSSLLVYTKDQTANWQNRGLFYTDHLTSKCPGIETWGKRRVFNMRGIELELLISSYSLTKDKEGDEVIDSLSFTVSVKNNSNFDNEIHEIQEVPDWFHKSSECGNKK